MTNAESVYQYGIIAGHIFAMLDNANNVVIEWSLLLSHNSPIHPAIRLNET